METLNHTLFYLINARPDAPQALLSFATFCARYLILTLPFLLVSAWCWPPQHHTQRYRKWAIQFSMALCLGLLLSYSCGVIFPHQRPFVENIGTQFLTHAATNSYPSNHATAIFTLLISVAFWLNRSIALWLTPVAGLIVWSRIYLGVHWPLDMLGGLLTAMIACCLITLVNLKWIHKGVSIVHGIYQVICSYPIKKRWLKK